MSRETRAPFRYIPHTAPTPAAARAERLRDPGFGRVFTDHMAVGALERRQGLARRGSAGARAVLHRPRQRRAALRAGDFRGPEGLSRRRRRRAVPARAQRQTLPGFGRAAGDADAARKPVPRRRRGDRAHRPRLDSGRRRQPLSAAVHVRQRGVSRRQAGERISVRHHRLAGRLLLQGRQEGGDGLAV